MRFAKPAVRSIRNLDRRDLPDGVEVLLAPHGNPHAPAFRVGKAKAITATARKLAILVYRTLKDGLLYKDPGADAYDARVSSGP